jgi:DNA-binding HxlR family transcriptional regulator
MAAMSGYGQFCPVAKAAEVVAERWTPLVLRELLCGSRRFNDLRRGVPLMSRSLLAKRLRELERAGVVERRSRRPGIAEYHLTAAGEELRPLIEQLGAWGQRWIVHDLERADLDPSLLMWDMRRSLRHDRLPVERAVVRFEFVDVLGPRRRWWLLAGGGDADLCMTDPGFAVDLAVSTSLKTLTRYWIGQVTWRETQADPRWQAEGPRSLVRSLPQWLGQSSFAGVERPPGAPA